MLVQNKVWICTDLARMNQQAAGPRILTLDLRGVTATRPVRIVAQYKSPLSYQGKPSYR